MKTQRQSFATARPAVVALIAACAALVSVTEAAGQDHHQQFSAPVRQTAPPPEAFRQTAPVQAPSASLSTGTWQTSPAGLNGTMHIEQYTPPGLSSSGVNAGSGTYYQGNPPGLNTQHPEMSMPGGLAGAGGPAGSNASGQTGPGAAGAGAYGSAYPVGYQSQPAARQFTCRTSHYYCLVPYTGACQCENDRREREQGATVD